MESVVCLSVTCADGTYTLFDLVRVAAAAFLAILFLQSGIDKILDRKGNLQWLNGHFEKSLLASQVAPMLGVVTVVELAAGGLSALGVPMLLMSGNRTPATVGALLAIAAILMLFFGQRMAKDYDGAAALVPYFAVACGSLCLMDVP